MSDALPSFKELAAEWRRYLESPIEELLWDALVVRLHSAFAEYHDFAFGRDELRAAHLAGRRQPEFLIVIAPQCEWSAYRIDIALLVKIGTCGADYDELLLAIECDGHDFHDRTKEQARRDRARDRDLARGGWITQRFTGSEIFADADGCADEIYHLLMEWNAQGLVAERLREHSRLAFTRLSDPDQPWLG